MAAGVSDDGHCCQPILDEVGDVIAVARMDPDASPQTRAALRGLVEAARRQFEAEQLPAWVLDLVAGLERYEDEHPKLHAQYASHGDKWLPADCPGALLDLVPADVRAAARRRAAP